MKELDCSFLAACVLASFFAANLKMDMINWKIEADERIEGLRKQNAQITVSDENQNPLPDVDIRVRQIKKAFPFGAAMGGSLLREPSMQQYFQEHFNWAVFGNESKWYDNEKAPEQITYDDADALYEWCNSRQIPVRGHCIFWEPEKWQMDWVKGLDTASLKKAVERRIDNVVSHFIGKFRHWDVNNEMMHGSFFQDRLGKTIWPWMFQRTHEIDPDCKLFVNDFNVLSVDQDFTEVQTEEYVESIRELLIQNAHISGIGIQGHVWNEDILSNPRIIQSRLDTLGALNIPLWITEFDVAVEDERERADILELVYRTAYSHPMVEGVMMWVVWAGNSWRGPNAGILNVDWSINEAGRRFESLMAEWNTDVSGRTNEAGQFTFRGFHGQYEVTIIPDGREPIVRSFDLKQIDEPIYIRLQV
jgi:GH35 family endo-1,4-beta-xylanase